MGRKKAGPAPVSLTALRAARLYKLLTLLGDAAQSRKLLLTRLKLDIRGFYRDLEALRLLGIDIVVRPDGKYALAAPLDEALEHLPFPDPGLNVRDALQLSNGTSPAHRKLRQRVNTFLHGPHPSRPAGPNKPR